MKNTTKILTLAGTLLLGLTMGVSAEPGGKGKGEGKRGPGGPGGRKPPPEVIAEFDKDGDGKLNEEERKAAREARRAKILEKFDADGSGDLDEDERKAAREAMRERRGGKGGPKGRKGPRGKKGEGDGDAGGE